MLCFETQYVLVLSADHIYDMAIAHCFNFTPIATRMQHWRRLFIPANRRTSVESSKWMSRAVLRVLKRSPRTPKQLPGRPERVLASMGIY
jgi:ADP-glucose pyrophosphorylase